MKKTMLVSTVVFALSLVLAAVPVNQALAACGPIDLSSSEWDLVSLMKASVKKVGKVKLGGQLTLLFSDGSNEFLVEDPEGDWFTGTYLTDSKGKVQLTPKSNSLEDYIKDKIGSVAVAAGYAISYNNLEVKSYKALAKVKSVKTGVTLSVSISIRATADISFLDQQVGKAKISISLKAKGTKVMSVASTRWFIETKYKAGVKGLGKGTDVGTLDVIFGPNIGEGVLAGEFKAIDDEFRVFTGSYSVDTKGKVTVVPNWGELAGYLEDLIEIEAGASNAIVTITKVTCIAKVKHAMSITVALSVKFTAECDVPGKHISGGKGSYSQKGKGCATEYDL